jgi:hypothetical protein
VNEPDSAADNLADVPRGAEEIARRAIILSAVSACAYGDDKGTTIGWLQSERLWSDVSPSEQAFLVHEHTLQQQIDMTWRIEALVPLLWVIHKLDGLPPVDRQFDPREMEPVLVFRPAAVSAFVASAVLRSDEEIAEAYEAVHLAHWRVNDARVFGKPIPTDVNPSVVRERHYAFNWIVGYGNQVWDDITTDT